MIAVIPFFQEKTTKKTIYSKTSLIMNTWARYRSSVIPRSLIAIVLSLTQEMENNFSLIHKCHKNAFEFLHVCVVYRATLRKE